MSAIVRCARALVAGCEREDFCFAVDGGRIAVIDSYDALAQRFPGAQVRTYGSDAAVVPGFINGHSHAYQILLRGWADDLPFSRWRSDALYAIVPELRPDDIYWTFRLAFDEMLAAGITTATEFFYLNGAGNAHAEAAIRAAGDAGIRLVFARAWMDAPSAPRAFRETIAQAAARTRALIEANPNVQICVAPHSLHAASQEMIAAAAAFAHDAGCLVHIHVAEAEYEGAQTLERFGATPVALLHRMGVLDERLVAVHAIYLSDDEKRMLAASGAAVVHNPMTNQYLGDGICDVAGLRSSGVRVGLGTDADVHPSMLEEMRAAALLQKIARRDGSALGAKEAWFMGTSQGAAVLDVRAGDLYEGAYADYAVLDCASADPWTPLLNFVVYRAEVRCVRETYVAGTCVRRGTDSVPAGAREALAPLLPRLRL